MVAAAWRPAIVGFFWCWVDLRPITETRSIAGYEFTVNHRSVCPQRRFASPADQRAAIVGLQEEGFSMTAAELKGYRGAVLFVAVPNSLPQRHDVTAAPIRAPTRSLVTG